MPVGWYGPCQTCAPRPTAGLGSRGGWPLSLPPKDPVGSVGDRDGVISLLAVELCHDPVDCQADFKIRQVNLGSPPRTFGATCKTESCQSAFLRGPWRQDYSAPWTSTKRVWQRCSGCERTWMEHSSGPSGWGWGADGWAGRLSMTICKAVLSPVKPLAKCPTGSGHFRLLSRGQRCGHRVGRAEVSMNLLLSNVR